MSSQNRHTNLSALNTILLCATIVTTVLFSGSEGGNTFNFYVTAVFVASSATTAILERRSFLFPPEILFLMLWLCYAILPSMGAQDLELAFDRMWLMLQIVILASLSINVMIWHGRTTIFALVYCASAALAYISSLAGIGFGVIDDSLLREMNSGSRIAGTHENANQFAMVCLTAQLAALYYVVQTKNSYAKMATGLIIVVLGVAIMNTGSRTAFVGMIFLVLGLAWAFRIWRARYLAITLIIISVFSLAGIGTYHALDEDNVIRSRIESYLDDEGLMGRYENLLRLFVNYGDVESIDISTETSMSTRAELIQDAWRSATEAPLGLGLDNFRVVTDRYAHSNFFELLATTGFIGLALYIAIYFSMLGRLLTFTRYRGNTKTLVRVFAISVLTLMITDIADVSYYDKTNWLFIALAISTIELYRKSISSQPATNRQSQAFAYGTN